jgi:hypothetical protein
MIISLLYIERCERFKTYKITFVYAETFKSEIRDVRSFNRVLLYSVACAICFKGARYYILYTLIVATVRALGSMANIKYTI